MTKLQRTTRINLLFNFRLIHIKSHSNLMETQLNHRSIIASLVVLLAWLAIYPLLDSDLISRLTLPIANTQWPIEKLFTIAFWRKPVWREGRPERWAWQVDLNDKLQVFTCKTQQDAKMPRCRDAGMLGCWDAAMAADFVIDATRACLASS